MSTERILTPDSTRAVYTVADRSIAVSARHSVSLINDSDIHRPGDAFYCCRCYDHVVVVDAVVVVTTPSLRVQAYRARERGKELNERQICCCSQ